MASILIIEDELITANGLVAIIKSVNHKVDTTITGCAKEALEYAQNNCYDVSLIDIQLLDYSGFETGVEDNAVILKLKKEGDIVPFS